MYRCYFKRIIDFVVALLALLSLAEFFMILIVILYFANKRAGVFFLQKRAGKKGREFNILKFKTMTDDRDVNGMLLPNERRITLIGLFLRKTSLDELPQLVNVLKGDMSLIGPRPLHLQYLPLYSEEQRRRLDVRPGISGWAQVNGRNAISWTQKFRLDVWYVDHLSFGLDVKIALLTLKKMILREYISASGAATTPFFNGKN